MDLELVSTEDLIDELSRRHECCIFCGFYQTRQVGSDREGLMRIKFCNEARDGVKEITQNDINGWRSICDFLADEIDEMQEGLNSGEAG